MGLFSNIVGRTVRISNNVINGNIVGGDLIISSDGNKLIINGQSYDTGSNLPFTVIIEGDVKGRVETASGDVSVAGNAGNIKTMSGDVTIEGDVSGDVGTMSGDVRAKSIAGNVKTMSGDIRR